MTSPGSRSSAAARIMSEPPLFAQLVGELGIDPEGTLIFYDTPALYTAARAWLMFRGPGHVRSAVLDGGLPAWRAAGNEVETGSARKYPPTQWPIPSSRPNVRTWGEVLSNIQGRGE